MVQCLNGPLLFSLRAETVSFSVSAVDVNIIMVKPRCLAWPSLGAEEVPWSIVKPIARPTLRTSRENSTKSRCDHQISYFKRPVSSVSDYFFFVKVDCITDTLLSREDWRRLGEFPFDQLSSFTHSNCLAGLKIVLSVKNYSWFLCASRVISDWNVVKRPSFVWFPRHERIATEAHVGSALKQRCCTQYSVLSTQYSAAVVGFRKGLRLFSKLA